MEVLVQQGKVIYVGSSNFAGWTIAQAQEAARTRHFLGLVSEQCLYNLAERHVEEELIPAAMHYGVGIIAWSPLFRGLLGGILTKEGGGRSGSEQTQKLLERHRDRIVRYEALCARLGEHPSAVALAWLLQQPGVTGPIVGPRTPEQFQSNLHALDVELDSATLEELDAIFPGPGPAPEVWAW
jgi:NDP-hexose C3-ketoreductase / dTDP-4-oxo-2-deoxy-alpha-D-pentos-2-ene 2,3-reductase